MKRIPIFIFTLSILLSQHPGDKAVRAGVDAFYNYEFDKSIQILTQARKDFPNHPGVHVTWAAAHWRRNEAHLPQNEIYANLNANLSEIESIYDSLLVAHPDHPEYLLYSGTARGLKARILLERFIEMDSKFHEHALKLAMAAKAKDGELASIYSGKMMDGCVSCHQVYAKDRFEGFSTHEEATHEH
ncbi:MAG: hypothetical protein HN927_00745 [Candidatus Marinimicrobia bacterium]|nr:hypothetical protein [Candidatus Neomarinimicrobiota bacterium]MBT5115063.1 hypothetical protein [Candidatus Neomarinimicrobiota bacterium]MBT6390570.1 hypothetical protein [Candidatus Neomarinimicrobiota bacterium]MBT7082757.1 hypothetical protein [Candidatus Neomarinimicrobiota bacterium]